MPVKDVVIRAQELGGRWTVLGSDSARGITVEDLTCDADTWGSRSCTFTLRRNGRVPWPDIGAFAPLEIESQGLPVWSGRVKGTPTTDGADRRITVNGEGWQYHLDDDIYQRTYVDASLSGWRDRREIATSILGAGSLVALANVQSDKGVLTLSVPAYTTTTNDQCGLIYDLGPGGGTAARWTLTFNTSNNSANYGFQLWSGNDPSGTGATTLSGLALTGWGALAGLTVSPTAGHRYLFCTLVHSAAGAAAPEVWVKILSSTIYTSSTYESGNVSILKASDVVTDARVKATLLLSSDTSKFTATTFSIPDFAMTKPDTPRNVINAINAYHNFQPRVTVDKLLEFRALPASASIQVDARSEFDEASAGDASEVYSGALISYTDAAGAPQTAGRAQSTSLYTRSAIQPTNPGAEVDVSNWSNNPNAPPVTFVRTTTGGEFTTGVGGFKMTFNVGANGSVQTSAWTGGTFIAGQGYRITADLRQTVGEFIGMAVLVDGINLAQVITSADNVFHSVSLDWVQPSSSNPLIYVSAVDYTVAGPTAYFDNLVLYEAAATVVSRRGFRRTFLLDTNMSLTPAAAQQIADTFLAAHKTQPFKGKLVVTGYGTATKTPSAARIPPAELLRNTGDLIRFSHLIDPDTGAIGREGRIASVSWDAPSDTTTIEIDSQSTNFEAFIARLGILTGAVK